MLLLCTWLQPSTYLGSAEKAATYLKRKLYDEKTHRLTRSFRTQPSAAPGFLEDYAFLITALLDLYEAGCNTSWLAWALDLQEKQVSSVPSFFCVLA